MSATNPVFASSGRAIQASKPQSHRALDAVESRRNNRFILKTDISRFYHSIYTHSLPWVLHTKAVAKRKRDNTLLGNRLDLLVRSAQDGQTVGIPIGPDTSLVLAEILMQACDKELINTIPGLRGHRYIDDYELGFRSRTEADEAFHRLESILAKYGLALNPRKTKVINLPAPLDSTWVAQLRRHPLDSAKARSQLTELIDYFTLAFYLAEIHSSQPVLQYAVARVSGIKIDPSNWNIFCTLLLNCAVPEPACLPYVLQTLIRRVNDGEPCPHAALEQALCTIITEHARLDHTSEVAWSLWACLALRIQIDSASASALVECDNSFVALLTLHANDIGLIPGGIVSTLWSSYMTTEALYDENWLLAYEANIKGWLPSVHGVDHVNSDPRFSFLKSAGVSFYDLAAAAPPATAPVPEPRVPSMSPTGITQY
ncbi:MULTISPECIES: RNA-directed DNA polymerase [unclassified Synechococcus]|uniref:RNA-directed DNA polymerase n=1 Tax=unclassified Synechococcus TaxID=2626047 RepID=UPI0008FF3475|nr:MULTISPECIES: RNA-directed DNA polymerase [unclassified Synechococcus]TWB87337.1 reverse transcriptase (RNA-dependent DNA polymerase) [Synechococcus sp. Ace-Pa]